MTILKQPKVLQILKIKKGKHFIFIRIKNIFYSYIIYVL